MRSPRLTKSTTRSDLLASSSRECRLERAMEVTTFTSTVGRVRRTPTLQLRRPAQESFQLQGSESDQPVPAELCPDTSPRALAHSQKAMFGRDGKLEELRHRCRVIR